MSEQCCQRRSCPTCQGSGDYSAGSCITCDGMGYTLVFDPAKAMAYATGLEAIIRAAQNHLAGEVDAIGAAPSLDWFLAVEMHKITGEPVC